MKCNSIRNKERSRASCRAGGAGDAVDFLVQNMRSDVLLLLNDCETGSWFTGAVRSSQAKNTTVLLTEFKDIKAKVFKSIDETLDETLWFPAVRTFGFFSLMAARR